VLRARLEDAFFFYESDKKKRLEERVETLSGIIFQAKLGSMQEKVGRVVKLARILSERLEPQLVEQSCRAALLCKADLITDMVGEFPSLQGVMGGAYARNDGEDESVCAGIQEHYMPLRAGAPVPPSAVGAIVGLADRIDTIAGCFGIGQMPTGTADPFGLRRLSLAVLHIVEEHSYDLVLRDIFSKALSLYGDKVDGSGKTVDTIVSFIQRRFVNDCVAREMDSSAVEAVAAAGFANSTDCLERIAALSAMRQDASFAVLAGSFKRIRNITREHLQSPVDESLLAEPAELRLYEVFRELQTTGEGQLKDRNYPGFLSSMLILKEPVDTFFDDVMVMAEDMAIRQNRLNLLAGLGELILQVGDISKMHEGS
jgi:glycyl-tRNA synthetase beta chain